MSAPSFGPVPVKFPSYPIPTQPAQPAQPAATTASEAEINPNVNSSKLLEQSIITPSNFQEKFKKSFEHLVFLKSKLDEPNYESAWQKSLENLTLVNLPYEYEQKILAIFENNTEQFRFRALVLVEFYKKLKNYFEIKDCERAVSISQEIFRRQEQLMQWYEGVKEESFLESTGRNVLWEKLFSKTLRYILNNEKKIKMASAIVSIWNKVAPQDLPDALKLRKNVFAYSFIPAVKWPDMAFDGFINAVIEEYAKQTQVLNEAPLERKFYKILSYTNFEEDHEKTIFEKLKNFPKFSRVEFKLTCAYLLCAKLKALHGLKKFEIETSKKIDLATMEKDSETLKSLSETLQLFRKDFVTDELEKDSSETLKRLVKTLNFLGNHFVANTFPRVRWAELCNYISNLAVSKETKKELLEVFKNYEKPPTLYRQLTDKLRYSKEYFWSFLGATSDESGWKGEKYHIMLQTIQKWTQDNKKGIEEKLTGVNPPPALTELLEYIERMSFPEFFDNADKNQRRLVNDQLREMHTTYLTKLRAALDEKFMLALDLSTKYPHRKLSGPTQILKDICDQRFMGANMIPFMAKLMESMITIGLQELSKTKIKYIPYLNTSIYPSPLDVGIEVIHEAIEAVPQEYKASLSSIFFSKLLNVSGIAWDPHMQGAPNYYLMDLMIKGDDDKPKHVRWLRFATPTTDEIGVDGIIPDLRGFAHEKKILLCSLQSSIIAHEASRTKKIFGLNESPNFTVAVFPMGDSSDIFAQKDGYADKKEVTFNTFVGFSAAVVDRIIPDLNSKNTINAPGNYLFPPSILADEDYKKRIQKCLDLTNHIFFNDAESLPSEDRCVFIKFFDVILALDLIRYTDSDHFAFLCNHSADRTGVLVTLLFKIILIAYGKEDEQIDPESGNPLTWRQVWSAFVDGQPIVVAKRGMNDFYDGLVEALKILDKTEVRKRIIEKREALGILGFKFPFATKKNENDNNNKT